MRIACKDSSDHVHLTSRRHELEAVSTCRLSNLPEKRASLSYRHCRLHSREIDRCLFPQGMEQHMQRDVYRFTAEPTDTHTLTWFLSMHIPGYVRMWQHMHSQIKWKKIKVVEGSTPWVFSLSQEHPFPLYVVRGKYEQERRLRETIARKYIQTFNDMRVWSRVRIESKAPASSLFACMCRSISEEIPTNRRPNNNEDDNDTWWSLMVCSFASMIR